MATLEELQSENEKLKKEIEVKSDLISISAHQLRTSLSALKWILSMFNDHDMKNISAEQKNLIDKATGSSEHMLFLVNTLLTLNHSNATAIELAPVDTNIQKLVEETLFEFQGFARNMNVTLSSPDSHESSVIVHCDPEMIRIVLSGLIENAIKYSNEGGVVTSAIKKDTTNHSVEISIHNDGTSINENEQLQIFNKFFRSADAIAKKVKGSGLGLYIAQKIIDCHKGKIWFESSKEHGTTFFVSLPIE